jgi:hypothetical protein
MVIMTIVVLMVLKIILGITTAIQGLLQSKT